MKILDVVRFNQGVAYVVDEKPEKLYQRLQLEGNQYIYGTDASGVLFRCFQYDRPSERWKAFGGWKFDLKMQDGSVEHCDGQWWDAGSGAIAKHLGIELVPVTIQILGRLRECFVFTAEYVDKAKLDVLTEAFNAEHPNYTVWGYRDYEQQVKRDAPERAGKDLP